MNSKIIKLGFGAAVITGIILPVLIFAAVEKENGNQSLAGSFCEKISALPQIIDQRIDSFNSKLNEKRTNITDKITENRKQRDSKLNEIIQKWDKNREEHFAKLMEKAQNDEQKQIMLAFKEAVQTAILNRRNAIGVAIQSFRANVDAMTSMRRKSIDDAAEVYKTAINAALAKAKDDCKNGVDIGTVRTNLKNDLKAAKDRFILDKQSIEKIEVDMNSMIDIKKSAIEKANSDFQAALEKAKADFKAAMGQVKEEGTVEKACTDSGGTVEKSSCCASAGDFPNLCLIGACGCSLENSHEVKTCNCGEGKCFNGKKCTEVSAGAEERKYIEVLPLEGNLAEGNTVNIRWTQNGLEDKIINIYLFAYGKTHLELVPKEEYRNNFAILVAEAVSVSQGSFQWKIPSDLSQRYSVSPSYYKLNISSTEKLSNWGVESEDLKLAQSEEYFIISVNK